MSVARACLLFALPWAASCGASSPRPLLVAAAASTRPAFEAIVAEYRAAGHAIEVAYGASGQLVAQLEQGGAFAVFFGADRAHAERLVELGHAETVFEYGRGRLVLWVREASALHPERDGLGVLANARVRKIALANPRLAPYGAAALAVLEREGLLAQLGSRLVHAENVAQAMHFAASGAADVAFVAASLLTGSSASVRGRFVELDVPATVSLTHCGAMMVRSGDTDAARAFVAFALGPVGRRLFAAHGLDAPD